MSVVLGIGTNLGDRLKNLRMTICALSSLPNTSAGSAPIQIQAVSPIYISDALLPENAPADWNKEYLNIAIRCETSLEPFALLDILQQIEVSIGREENHAHWAPRIIDIDILSWDQQIVANERLTIPHKNLLDRPFALWPLADVTPFWIYPTTQNTEKKTAAQLVEPWGSRFTGEAPFRTRQIAQRIKGTRLIGIVNVTPDSFSDGGNFIEPELALQQAIKLVEQGAEIIDLGAESSSSRATALTWEEEWRRLEPALALIQQSKDKFLLPPIISIDTYHAETAKRAITYGIDWINDVSGFDDINMCNAVKDIDVKLVVMHHLRIPENRNHLLPRDQDPVKEILNWGEQRIQQLIAMGIHKERIIFDPGVGFGKMAEQSFEILKRIKEFQLLNVDIYVGHSRKSFLALQTGTPAMERDVETAVMSLYLSQQGVKFLRVHNVEINSKVLRMDLQLSL